MNAVVTSRKDTVNSTAPIIEYLSTDQLDPHLTAVLGVKRADDWSRNREPYHPLVTVLHLPDGDAAALTSGRPNTRYTKIADLWASTDAAGAQLLDHLVAASVDRGDACIKWQIPLNEDLPQFATALGFSPLQTPIPSGAGTEEFQGFALWHSSWPHPQLRHYSQTTDFTCGAVAAMTALTALGLDPFGVAHESGMHDSVTHDNGSRNNGARDRELAFWRMATNFPACEPVGLAVALHDALYEASTPATTHLVELHLDAEGAVLLEDYTGADREYREILQAESGRQANARGIPRCTDRVDATEIVRRVAGGDYALLLIDDAPMHDSSTAHWVLAHAAQGDTVLLHEPWVTDKRGETWVDSHDLPVAIDVLDRLVTWGDPSYRGVIFLTH